MKSPFEKGGFRGIFSRFRNPPRPPFGQRGTQGKVRYNSLLQTIELHGVCPEVHFISLYRRQWILVSEFPYSVNLPTENPEGPFVKRGWGDFVHGHGFHLSPGSVMCMAPYGAPPLGLAYGPKPPAMPGAALL